MKLLDFIQSETDIKNLNVVLTDLNGIFRGKKIPISQINKIQNGHFRMPISVMNLDIWGNDIENSKWGNLSISFAEEPNDDDAVYVLLEFNDKEKIAIPFTPQVLMYFQLGLMNWLNDADDTELRKMLPDFMN